MVALFSIMQALCVLSNCMLLGFLRSAREKRKEMKLLLDMYKGVSKETRDKVELLKNEKTLRNEVDELKAKLLVVTEDVVKQSKKFADDDHKKECRKLQTKIDDLQKTMANMKQVCFVLIMKYQ